MYMTFNNQYVKVNVHKAHFMTCRLAENILQQRGKIKWFNKCNMHGCNLYCM